MIQRMLSIVILPKWDNVTNHVSTPSSGPSKAIRSIAMRFLLPNLFLLLVLIKLCTLKACSHVVVDMS